MTVVRAVAVFLGNLGLLVGVALISGAIWILFEDRDDDGFYASDSDRFERSSYAIVSGDFDQLTEMPSWLADLAADPVDVRIRGVGDGSLFVGVAHRMILEAILPFCRTWIRSARLSTVTKTRYPGGN